MKKKIVRMRFFVGLLLSLCLIINKFGPSGAGNGDCYGEPVQTETNLLDQLLLGKQTRPEIVANQEREGRDF